MRHEHEPRSPSERYAHCLLIHLSQSDKSGVTLRSSEDLPALPMWEESHGEPRFQNVVNRLKVMADLNPLRYLQPVEAKLEVILVRKPCVVFLRFDDDENDPSVSIQVEEDLEYDGEILAPDERL